MGARLGKMYEWVGQQGGITAQMRLAMKTLLSQDKATAAPDTPEMIEKFKAAIKEIVGKEPPPV